MTISIDYTNKNNSNQIIEFLHDATTNVLFQATVGIKDS